MKLTDRQWVGCYFGVLALFGVGLGISALYIRSQPKDWIQQKNLSMRILASYQKYWLDEKQWPASIEDAAFGFKSEVPDMTEQVRKADEKWGLSTRLYRENSKQMLEIWFARPKANKFNYELSERERR
ncbi:MAG TPA: hypothetical protein VEX38_08980 [Fimbriimonadaceae bacterium]|nr:hypothetical protein [Fimbriimonadaceae bacterium]